MEDDETLNHDDWVSRSVLHQTSDWFALVVNPKSEDKARVSLGRAGFGTYLPKMRIERQHRRTKQWDTREILLMPRYIFVQMPAAAHDWFALRRCDGVHSVLGTINPDGETTPFPIPSRSVERIMAMQADMQFDDTRAAKIRRREIGKNQRDTITMKFPVGSKVRAIDGPFSSFRGQVTNVSAQGIVTALFNLMGRMVPVELEDGQIEPIASNREAA